MSSGIDQASDSAEKAFVPVSFFDSPFPVKINFPQITMQELSDFFRVQVIKITA